MKKNHKKKNSGVGFSIIGSSMFFLIIGVTSVCAILIYNSVITDYGRRSPAMFFSVAGSIILGSIICSIIDLFRRKYMVDIPTQKILDATSRIARGDFNINLEITHSHKKFNQYDAIMENINIMSRELSKNEVLKTNFISNVSHEIKTPLSVIQNYAMLLQKEKLSKEEKQKYLRELVIATKRLSNLITNILKLNKLENQQLMPEIVEFNLGEELRLSVLQHEELIDNKNINLICNIDDITISSARDILQLVWNNLISNAIKFTNEGGTITIDVKQHNGYAVVKVSDSGIGISKEVGKHIFEKFYQGDTSHASEGNGLGLALVKEVIDILGGEIEVESELNVGTCFTIKLKV